MPPEDRALLSNEDVTTVRAVLDAIGCTYKAMKKAEGTWVIVTGIRDVLQPVTQHDVDAALEAHGFDLEWSLSRQILQNDRSNNPSVVKK